MKEATGELSMTVVTIIAVIIIAAIVAALRTPIINYINKQWGALTGEAGANDKIGEDTGKNFNKGTSDGIYNGG